MKRVLLFAIILVGLSLRIIGSDWGFPFLLHPDEKVVAEMPLDMAKRSSLDPREYNHPDHLDIYANAILYHATSLIKFGKPLTETFEAHTLTYYRLSRILVALMGTVSIMAAYLIGRHYRQSMGLIAALLVAVFQPFVNDSHFITADIPLTLFVLTTILFSIRYQKNPSVKDLLVASFFVACAVSVKYPGVLSLGIILSAVISKHHGDRKLLIPRISTVLVSFLACLLCISPYLFLNISEVIGALFVNASPRHLGGDGLGWTGNLFFYAESYYGNSGIIMLAFLLVGAFYLVRNEKLNALPLFFGLFYWIVLSMIGLHWERWALPMYTAPLLITAYGLSLAYDRSLSVARKYLFALWCVAALLILAKLLVNSAVTTANFTLKDTRFAAYQYTKGAGITEENTLYEGYTPFVPGSPYDGSVRDSYMATDPGKTIKYIILSSGMYGRYRAEKERYGVDITFYDKVLRLPLIREIDPNNEVPSFGPAYPLLRDNDLAKGLAFLVDYARNRKDLLTGPTILIYKYNSPGFLDLEPRPPHAPGKAGAAS